MTDIEMVKMLAGNTEISDDFVAFQLERTQSLLLTYLNVEKLPEGLHPILLEIAAFKLKANSSGSKIELGKGTRQVGSLSDGNQSVSFNSLGASSLDWNNDASILQAYADILGRYRRMVVDRPLKGCYRAIRFPDGRKHRW